MGYASSTNAQNAFCSRLAPYSISRTPGNPTKQKLITKFLSSSWVFNMSFLSLAPEIHPSHTPDTVSTPINISPTPVTTSAAGADFTSNTDVGPKQYLQLDFAETQISIAPESPQAFSPCPSQKLNFSTIHVLISIDSENIKVHSTKKNHQVDDENACSKTEADKHINEATFWAGGAQTK